MLAMVCAHARPSRRRGSRHSPGGPSRSVGGGRGAVGGGGRRGGGRRVELLGPCRLPMAPLCSRLGVCTDRVPAHCPPPLRLISPPRPDRRRHHYQHHPTPPHSPPPSPRLQARRPRCTCAPSASGSRSPLWRSSRPRSTSSRWVGTRAGRVGLGGRGRERDAMGREGACAGCVQVTSMQATDLVPVDHAWRLHAVKRLCTPAYFPLPPRPPSTPRAHTRTRGTCEIGTALHAAGRRRHDPPAVHGRRAHGRLHGALPRLQGDACHQRRGPRAPPAGLAARQREGVKRARQRGVPGEGVGGGAVPSACVDGAGGGGGAVGLERGGAAWRQVDAPREGGALWMVCARPPNPY